MQKSSSKGHCKGQKSRICLNFQSELLSWKSQNLSAVVFPWIGRRRTVKKNNEGGVAQVAEKSADSTEPPWETKSLINPKIRKLEKNQRHLHGENFKIYLPMWVLWIFMQLFTFLYFLASVIAENVSMLAAPPNGQPANSGYSSSVKSNMSYI